MPVARTIGGGVLAALLALSPSSYAAARAVVWVRADDADFERDLNQNAARGLRLAAISDGLPCSIAALQTPEGEAPPTTYRVVRENDLAKALPTLADEGFVPTRSAQVTFGTRHQVVFERAAGKGMSEEWRLVSFEKIEDLEGALSSAAAGGFRARLLVRLPLRSWAGLSERGLVLTARPRDSAARTVKVLVGTKSDLKDAIAPLADATKAGWDLDVVASSSRDGARDGRRERLVMALSRGDGAAAGARPVTLSRSTFGMIGRAIPIAAVPFWDQFAFAWTPAERRQIWASPIRLSEADSQCGGLETRMRWKAPDEQRSTIVSLIARKLSTGGYELVVVTADRL